SRRAAEERAREEKRAKEAQVALDELARKRAEHESTQARTRESQRSERAAGKHVAYVSRTTFVVTLLFISLGTLGLMHLTMVRPLQRELAKTAAKLNAL